MGTFFVNNDTYVGKCFWTQKRANVTSVFSYDDNYLAADGNWNIDPSLSLVTGAQPVKNGLLGAFRDASPDRWGQTLIRHRYDRKMRTQNQTPRNLVEVDYLLGVSDLSRQGDLRFSLEVNGEFQYPTDDIPKLISLPMLLNASHRYTEKQDEDAISSLLDAGSASLGGARPKTAVYDSNDLYIAKFPHRQDKWDVMAWEWVCLNIAAEAGMNIPVNRLIDVNGQNVLLLRRFDRKQNMRIGYISAMTLLDLRDGEHADYSEIAEKLRDVSVCVTENLHELYRRIILSLLVNNTDDHLRNHGLLRTGSGWCLSPVFDVNPNPDISARRVTSIFGEVRKQPALDALRLNAAEFALSLSSAEKIIDEVSSAVRAMEKYAHQAGISKDEQQFIFDAIERC